MFAFKVRPDKHEYEGFKSGPMMQKICNISGEFERVASASGIEFNKCEEKRLMYIAKSVCSGSYKCISSRYFFYRLNVPSVKQYDLYVGVLPCGKKTTMNSDVQLVLCASNTSDYRNKVMSASSYYVYPFNEQTVDVVPLSHEMSPRCSLCHCFFVREFRPEETKDKPRQGKYTVEIDVEGFVEETKKYIEEFIAAQKRDNAAEFFRKVTFNACASAMKEFANVCYGEGNYEVRDSGNPYRPTMSIYVDGVSKAQVSRWSEDQIRAYIENTKRIKMDGLATNDASAVDRVKKFFEYAVKVFQLDKEYSEACGV